MNEAATLDVSLKPTRNDVGDKVWDRVWRHLPSDEKDDALLAREERSQRWKHLSDRLTSTFGGRRDLRSIELGSGRGDASVLLARRGVSTSLFDCCESALEAARQRFDRLGLSASYVKGDLLGGLADERGCFDISTSLGVVEHFRDEERTRVLRSHFEVLRPGGLAMVSVPHAWCVPYRVWKYYLEARGWWPYGFELPYSHREMRRRALDAGFERVETYSFEFLYSVGTHWVKRFTGRTPRWAERRSVVDRWMGSSLVLFAWRGGGER